MNRGKKGKLCTKKDLVHSSPSSAVMAKQQNSRRILKQNSPVPLPDLNSFGPRILFGVASTDSLNKEEIKGERRLCAVSTAINGWFDSFSNSVDCSGCKYSPVFSDSWCGFVVSV